MLPDDFTMDGKTLVGWAVPNGVEYNIGDEVVVYSDMVFIGKWITEGKTATVGEVEYDTPYNALIATINNKEDGSVVEIYSDSEGEGIGIFNGTSPAAFTQGLTVDFNNHEYIMSSGPVGSPETESQTFHFERDNTVVLKDGIIKNESNASMLIQNYSNLTLDNIELVPLNIESDPAFPNHHPDPSVEANNKMLKDEVIKTHADVGIGIDGDGDRVGIIDENGTMIFIDFFAIIIWRDIMDKVENKNALFDVKCSKSLVDEIVKLGGTPVCYRTGNSYMKAKMREGDFAFGSELSGHVFFRDRWDNIDDGLYAGLRLVEILSKTDKTVSELLDGVNRYYSSPEIIIRSTDEEKFKVIENIKNYCIEKGYSINDIDGVRAEFDNGWALVRASNTGPNITVRFEGKTQEDEKAIEEEFMSLIKK